jgi:enterochelin esterase family protein
VTLAIERLLTESDVLDAAAVTRFIETHRSPIVEGSSVTFLFHGDATDVRLRHFIMGFPSSQAFRRVDGTDLWFLTMEVPAESRIEYKLEVRRGRKRHLILDPLNPDTARDPFGKNSVCQGSGYERPDWTRPDPDARKGELETVGLHSEVFGADVDLRVYHPARLRTTRRYPLLIAFDGEDYENYCELSTVLDNLIHRYEIPPMLVALSQSPDRFADYTASADHARFVAEELMPALTAQLPAVDDPAERCLMGASLGAVASFWTAFKYPGTFGRLLLQSGSFRFNDTGYEEHHPALGSVVEFVNAYRAAPIHVADRVFVSCGRYESLIADNRALQPHLAKSGMRVNYVESRDGHNWENWRDRLRVGLSWLFPGPLGLVYE